jgi:hypothetical protein
MENFALEFQRLRGHIKNSLPYLPLPLWAYTQSSKRQAPNFSAGNNIVHNLDVCNSNQGARNSQKT